LGVTRTHANNDFVTYWHGAGPKLSDIRSWELRNFNHQEHLAAIDALLQIGVDHAVSRTTSGLVELQRVLAKAAK
jgi:hypothetical protein